MKALFVFVLLAYTASGQTSQPGRDLVRPTGPTRRLALVIGNDAYQANSELHNAVNDARSMKEALEDVGFTVKISLNVTQRQIETIIDEFTGSVNSGDIALFFYAGHGIQISDQNYLIPVDFQAQTEVDAKYQSYAAQRVQDKLEAARAGMQILVLDACRNNPFRGLRGGSGGLAVMHAGKGTYIAFATSPGQTADDHPSGKNGLFTGALISVLKEPGLSIDEVFNRVREQVYQLSGSRQLPWTVTSVMGPFVFRDLAAQQKKAAEERARLEAELADLDRQVAELRQRRQQREELEKQQEAAVVRERLRFQQAEQARLKQEEDRLKATTAEVASANERQRRADGETKLAELRKRREQEEAALKDLAMEGMTLAEARQRVATLEREMAEIRTSLSALRDQAVGQIENDWRPRREQVSEVIRKGTFETTAQYEERAAAARAVEAEVAQKYSAVRMEVDKRYADEADLQTKSHRNRIEELKGRRYTAVGTKVEFAEYDADQNRLIVRVNGDKYLFSVPADEARTLYARLDSVKVEQLFSQEEVPPLAIVIVEPGTAKRFLGRRLTEERGGRALLVLVQEAMGGRGKLAAIKDWRRTSKETWEPAKGTTHSTVMFVAPSSLKEESIGGNKTAKYSNGRTGWTWSSSHGTISELPNPTVSSMVFRILNTLVLSDGDTDRTVSLAAPDTIVISDKYHNSVTLTVDVNSRLPRKLSWREPDGAMLEEAYSDWRRIGGTMWWFHMTRARDARTFLGVQIKDIRINTGLTDHDLSAPPAQLAQHSPPRKSVVSTDSPVELKTDGDRRGTLVLFGDHIEYRDDGMGSGGGRAPYGPNKDNNFTLLCSEIVAVKAHGFKPILFGSFEVEISASNHKYRIPAVRSGVAAKAISETCGLDSRSDR